MAFRDRARSVGNSQFFLDPAGRAYEGFRPEPSQTAPYGRRSSLAQMLFGSSPTSGAFAPKRGSTVNVPKEVCKSSPMLSQARKHSV
ncbi:hypothetical protein AAVH_36863, partial [Aphelenchoides avenae]